MREQLIEAMENAIREVKQLPGKAVQIFHHNDSDGLSSGAILTRAFTRAGFKIKRFCLEKPYPALLQKVYRQEGGLIIFADFAGRIAPILSELNRGRNLTLILDHHVAEAATDPKVHNLDPDLYGLKGDRDISGSTTCYLFAQILDSANSDLAHIAAIGAVGDEFFVDGCLAGENRDVTLEAVNQGKMEIRKQEHGERYILNTTSGPVGCDEFGAYLDTLGAAGFYQKGPDMGIKVCLEGVTSESDRITGFEVGGDDYMVKPFSPRELSLRVKSILKRTMKSQHEAVHNGMWKLEEHLVSMDDISHKATIDDRELDFTPAEWKILWYLATNQGIVISRDRILGECLDYMAGGSERTVDTHVKNIRLKLGDPSWIETVRGYGYRFSGIVQ